MSEGKQEPFVSDLDAAIEELVEKIESGEVSFEEQQEYWSSEYGVTVRLEMLADYIRVEQYNNALTKAGAVFGVKKFRMVGALPVCEYCQQYYGRVYSVGQFMPSFPAHPNCTHSWQVFYQKT